MQNTNNREKNLDWLKEQSVEYQLSLFQDYAEMMKILANNLMMEDIENKCGERYSRLKPEEGRYSRWGVNPGSIKVGQEKVPIEIPRYYDNQEERAQN